MGVRRPFSVPVGLTTPSFSIPRVANIDRPLNTLKGVSVRTEQILEESYPVAERTKSVQVGFVV